MLRSLEVVTEQAQNAMANIAVLEKELAQSKKQKEKLKLEYEQKTIVLLYTEIFNNAKYDANDNQEYDKAISSLWRCIELNVNDTLKAEAYFLLSGVTSAKILGGSETELDYIMFIQDPQYHTESIQYLKKAIELNPNHFDAFRELGYTLFHIGDLTNSLQYYDKVIEIGNLSTLTHMDLRNNQFTGIIPDEVCNLDIPWGENCETWHWCTSIENNQFCPPISILC